MAYKNTVKDYSQMIGFLTRDKTTDVPGSMAHGLRTGLYDGGRIGFYAGGVVRLAKLLSDQGNTLNEILKQINIKFPNLGGGRKGKPNSRTGISKILKKELGEKVYKERYSPGGSLSESKSYGEDVIEKFKELRLTKTETDIEELLGISPSYQTKLARDLGLEKKSGSILKSKKFKDAKNVETEIDDLIDFNKGRNENLEEIFETIKDKTFLIGKNKFGKPSKDQVQKYISQKLMDKNQLSVDGYKQEIKKMLEDRSYVPQGLDPLSIKTEKLNNYHIPNYLQAKEELTKEIPSLKKRMETNISFRKKLKRKEKEKINPVLKIGRLATKARTKQTGRLDKLAKAGKLSDREEVINWTQTAIQKVSNDQIKQNPTKILAYLKANPDKLKMLGTRVDPATGDIYYENPNLSFLNDNPKDSSRFFEMDHNREISKGDFLLDVPENRASVPRILNSGFKRDAEKFLESNPNPNDPKVKKILEEAKKLRVRLKPNVEKGIFKSSDFFDYGTDPINKINDTISFWTPDFKPQYYPVKKDSLGKIKLGTIGAGGVIVVPTTGYTENDYKQIKQDLISTGQMQDAAIEDQQGFTTGEKLAAGTAGVLGVGTKTGRNILGKLFNVATGPTGMFALTKAFEPEGGYDLSRTSDRLGFEVEAALAPTLVKGVTDVSSKIKNPFLRKGLETLAGVRIPKTFINPTNVLKAARIASPIGIASLAGEGIYKLGKLGYEDQKRFNALSPEEQAAERAEQEKFAFDIEGA